MIRFIILALVFALSVVTNAQQTEKVDKNAEKKALRKGNDHVRYEEYSLAIPFLEQAVYLNPENTEANYLLGKCYLKTGKNRAALQKLEKAYKQKPDFAEDLKI
ncbi:MAG: tetratricopeptide repeat protein, partial [Bacteroidia bacterium]|nr:tetratricopeptide repeat protein [Bacteroidia bacterium]